LRKLLDSPWLYFGLAGLLALVAAASQFDLNVPSRPSAANEEIGKLRDRDDVNVVFIMVDTLRADHLSAYGYERETTPVLSDLASVGVRFAEVEAQSSWTKTSMASLWSAVTPAATGVLRYGDGLAEQITLPAEIFRKAGFRTAGIFRNEWVAANFGFGQGFESYGRPAPSQAPERMERRSPNDNPLRGTDLDATEAAMEFVRSYQSEKFFLYIHYMDVHQYTYSEDSALFGTGYADAYDNAIHWTDRNIGHLLKVMDEVGVLDRTVVVIASDHGEAFGEHGTEGHARNLYREAVHVPWILSLPFRLEKPVVVESVVRNMDIWPTVLDLLGLPSIPDAEGISLVPLIQAAAEGRDPGDAAPASAVAQLDQTWGRIGADPAPMVAIRETDSRLIFRHAQPDRPEFFDLASDPGEQRNLAAEQPDQLAPLLDEARAVAARRPDEGRVIEVPVDDYNLTQLRALGYILEKEDETAACKDDPAGPGCPPPH